MTVTAGGTGAMPTLASVTSALAGGSARLPQLAASSAAVGASSSSTLLSSASFSWARNLASATPGGYSGGLDLPAQGAGGAGQAPVAGSAGWWSDPYAGPAVLGTARGVPRDLLCLALHTLGGFDFSGVPLLPFTREVLMLYLDDDDAAVRLEAALACCRVLVRPHDGSAGGSLDPMLSAALQAFGGAPSVPAGDDNDAAEGADKSGGGFLDEDPFVHGFIDVNADSALQVSCC